MSEEPPLLLERLEKSIEVMYDDEDLSICPLFKGGYINWGYYDKIDLSKKIKSLNRIEASQRLYEVCATLLNLNTSDKLLEFGCGQGCGLKFLQNKYFLHDVTGIDQSRFYIEQCKKKLPSASFIIGNASHIKVKKKFDKILSVEATQHFSEINEFFSNIHQLLEENGTAVITSFFGTTAKSTELVGETIQTVKDGIDILHYIDDLKNHLVELDCTFEIQSIGKYVFPGFDKWTAQTEFKNSWTRHWFKAFQKGLIDYFIIKLTKKSHHSNPIEHLTSAYQQGSLETYEYIRRMHRINKNLYHLSKRIKETDIKKIEIEDGKLLFTTRKENIKLYFDGRDRRGIPFELINFGTFEEEEDEIILTMINDGDVVFDLGANIGWSSLQINKNRPNSKIFSFEPIPETFEYLEKNIQINHAKNVQLFNLGISNRSGTCDFFYFPEASVIASQKNLINNVKAKPIKCKVMTLDDFVAKQQINKIDFLKCDVEGGELLVLEGSDIVLEYYLPILLLELCHEWTAKYDYHPNDIIRFLKEYGYQCFTAEKKKLARVKSLDKRREDDNKRNFFFLHKEKHKKLLKNLSL